MVFEGTTRKCMNVFVASIFGVLIQERIINNYSSSPNGL